ncbi:MAG: imidazoleglycerol-phosphate dehydratase [Polyangiaceae bacterium]|nr:imidazoleglycerol-phosphate dehydratase [Polyangiaceae bacterium]
MKKLVRKTKETKVEIALARTSGAGLSEVHVSTGLKFFDHMLTTLFRYAGLDCRLVAEGDLTHHVMEDVAITAGRAVRTILPRAAARFGERTIPMDDALVHAVIDAGGRFYFAGKLPSRLYTHVLRSFADSLGATLHVRILAGEDRHHIIEAAFKATGLALRQAMSDTGGEVFSLKGTEEIASDDTEQA